MAEKNTNFKYPEWQPQVQAVLIDFGSEKLRAQISVAVAAIHARLEQIGEGDLYTPERRAIADALAMLEFLQRRCDRDGG